MADSNVIPFDGMTDDVPTQILRKLRIYGRRTDISVEEKSNMYRVLADLLSPGKMRQQTSDLLVLTLLERAEADMHGS